MKKIERFLLIGFSALLLGSLFAPRVSAQFPMSEGKSSPRSDADRELEEHVAYLGYLVKLAEKRGAKRKVDPKLAIEQLQDDFTHLQIVNKDLVLTSTKNEELDLKFVARSTAEINKRAERLLSNLALPELPADNPATAPKPISNTNELKASIIELGWSIYRFVKSPLFKEPDVLDTPEAGKVRRELETIIGLSLQMKKSSEQLSKTSK
jgi:hypothetical protein